MSDKKTIAEHLNNTEYPLRISPLLREQAWKAGVVIVYGASDDLVCFDGAIHDEAGCYDGGVVRFDIEGIMPEFDSVDHEDENALEEYFKRKGKGCSVEALWCKEEGYSWTYKINIPHETFELVEEGENYCRGIVFELSDIPLSTPTETP